MIYMGADNNLAGAALGDLEEMEEYGSTDKVNFVALADIYENSYSFSGGFNTYTLTNNASEPVVPMMRIGKYPVEGVQSHLQDPKAVLKPSDGFNSASPANLTSFIQWAKQNYPANHYGLFIWNHGSGWLPGRTSTAVLSDDIDAGGTAMFIEEVKNAINNSGVHFDILDFDACNMASIEVAYELKDVTNYISASQRTEPGSGNDYKAISMHLTGNPMISAEQVGRIIIDSYTDYYMADGDFSVTKSLVKTEKLDALADSISSLSTALANGSITNNLELQSRFIEPIRFQQDVDLFNLLDVLLAYYPVLATEINNIKSIFSETVVYNRYFTGASEFPGWTFGSREFSQGQDVIVNGVGGLNIYLPAPRDFVEENVSYYSGTQFNFNSKWYDVIHYAYWGTPFNPTNPGGWWAGLVWNSNADLDLWVFEPDGYGGYVPVSPCLGAYGMSGSLSGDSCYTWVSYEEYCSFPNVLPGPYFFLANFAQTGFLGNDASCLLALGDDISDMEPMISDTFYISPTAPIDPDFGTGVVYFGFALYNESDGFWYMFWDDRTGSAVRENQFSKMKADFKTYRKSASKLDWDKSQISDDAIELYHKHGRDLKALLMEKME